MIETRVILALALLLIFFGVEYLFSFGAAELVLGVLMLGISALRYLQGGKS